MMAVRDLHRVVGRGRLPAAGLLAVGLALAAACAPAAPPSPTAEPAKPPAQKAVTTAVPAKPTAAPPSQPKPAAPAPTKEAAKPATKPTTPTELAVYQGADRQQLLEEGARREAKLTWYTSLAGPIVERLIAGYKQKYPFVAAEAFRAAENELVTKATQEAQAGQQVFDVIETPPAATRVLWDAGLLAPYFSPPLAQFPEALKTGEKNGVVESATVRISYIGFGYNTALIAESAVPRTHQDLMNPGLTGKLALAGTTTGHRWVGSVLKAMGEERGKAFLKEFADRQKPTVQQVSGKALLDLIAKGEVPASPTIFRDHVLQAEQEQKAPVKWVPLDPVVGNAGQGGFAAKTKNPHAALLFLDYLFSDGQKVLKDNFYSTGLEKMPFTPWIPEQGKTTAEIEKDIKLWDATFKGTFR